MRWKISVLQHLNVWRMSCSCCCCCSESPDHPDEETIRAENKEFGDIIRLDTLDTYEDLSAKTIKLFSSIPDMFAADFYFKVDDDVAVNTDALITYLKAKQGQGNLYAVSLLSSCLLNACFPMLPEGHEN